MINPQRRFAHVQPTYPVHHKRKVPFGPKLIIPASFPETALELRRLDSELDRFILSEKDYASIVADAFASNIHYSTKLEGNPLSIEEVQRLTRDSLDGQEIHVTGWPGQEIINHVASWRLPTYFRLPWTIDRIRGIHAILMKGVLPGGQQGTFRKERGQVEDQGVAYFYPAPHEHIEEELGALLEWTNTQAGAFNPV